jgi:hypothetical protein
VILINPLTAFASQRNGVALGPLTNTSDAARGGFTYATKYRAALIKATGSSVRLTLQGFVTAGHTARISNTTIGLAASATGTNPYDTTAAPTAITFGDSNLVDLTRGSFAVSDIISFDITQPRALIIAYDIFTNGYVSYVAGLDSNYITYAMSNVAQAGSQTKYAGYLASSGVSAFLHKLEVIS